MTMTPNSTGYDAILVVAFGGPEKPDDVMPFLENVTRGRRIPRERLLEVAEHYYAFGGVSPLNQQVRDLIAVLQPELQAHGIDLPIYWGNRNWTPMLPDTLREMTGNGVRKALALVLAAYSSYSSCRQYRENIEAAREAVGPEAPRVDKVRVFYNHPGFIDANADHLRQTLEQVPADRRDSVRLAFTAHSLPTPMADGSDYERQLTETSRLLAEAVGIPPDRWKLVYQSRSGRPEDPWLEPDIADHLDEIVKEGVQDVIVHPIGFLSDHVEVLYDLDDEARQHAESLGLNYLRASTVGTHPQFVAMLRSLIQERLDRSSDRPAIGRFPANHDFCPADCCPSAVRRTSACS